MATVRIYKVAELLDIPSTEVLTLLKKEHGIELKSASSTLEEVVARSFVERARSVVGAGRPDCPFCGEPIDPDGHLCVRANGFRRRDP